MLYNKRLIDHDAQYPELRIGREQIKETSHTKFLGLHIDNELKWDQHIKHINGKLASGLYAIRTGKNILNYQQLRTIYTAMFQPYMDYGNILWGNAAKGLIRPIEIKQKKALRLINNAPYNAHTALLFKSSRLLKCRDIYQLQLAKFMFNIYHNNMSDTLQNVFITNDTIHDHNTRNRNNPHIQTRRSALAQNSIMHEGPKLWQNLPEGVKSARTIHSFTRRMKKHITGPY